MSSFHKGILNAKSFQDTQLFIVTVSFPVVLGASILLWTHFTDFGNADSSYFGNHLLPKSALSSL